MRLSQVHRIVCEAEGMGLEGLELAQFLDDRDVPLKSFILYRVLDLVRFISMWGLVILAVHYLAEFLVSFGR